MFVRYLDMYSENILLLILLSIMGIKYFMFVTFLTGHLIHFAYLFC